MSLVVSGLVVGGALVLAGAVAVLARRRLRHPPALPPPPVAALPPKGLIARGFTADVGDVVSLAACELWLERAWLLREEEPVTVLYFAREAVLALLPPPGQSCFRLQAIELPRIAEPPTTLEHDGNRYQRQRRRPVVVEPQGSYSAPFDVATLAEYEGTADDVLWLLSGGGQQLAWRGQRISAIELERWGPGQS